MAYSDDAKYVSAYNKAVAAGNKARLLLADLNKAKPGTARHTDLKIKYDLAKADADKYEQERLTRKNEIDTAKSKEKETQENIHLAGLHQTPSSTCGSSRRTFEA